MNHRVHALASVLTGCLTGAYTPFLRPVWNGDERSAIAHWRDGALDPGLPERLVQTLASLFGDDYCAIPVNSGRAAIQLALEAMQLPAGSEVLLPSYSCTGVIVPVIQAGHAPVLVDIDQSLNISLASVVEAEGPRVKAIILPHLAGLLAADAHSIIEWARARNIKIIEDAAQSFGLRYGGQLAGTGGDAGIFSSGGGKPLFGPGGGWVISRDSALISALSARKLPAEDRELTDRRVAAFLATFFGDNRARSRLLLGNALRGYARRFLSAASFDDGSELEPFGFTLHSVSAVEAGIAIGQIGNIDSVIEGRTRNASIWRAKLAKLAFSGLRMPPPENNVFTKFWLTFEGGNAEREMQLLKSSLWRFGVEVESLYVPLHLRAPFAHFRRVRLATTERMWHTVFAVPVRPNLNAGDWSRIDAALEHAVRRLRGSA